MIEQTVDTTQLQEDIILLHSFVHGAEEDSVMLGKVNTPSLRNLVNTIQKNANLLIVQLRSYEERIERLEKALESYGITVVDGDMSYNVQTLHGLVEDGSAEENV